MKSVHFVRSTYTPAAYYVQLYHGSVICVWASETETQRTDERSLVYLGSILRGTSAQLRLAVLNKRLDSDAQGYS